MISKSKLFVTFSRPTHTCSHAHDGGPSTSPQPHAASSATMRCLRVPFLSPSPPLHDTAESHHTHHTHHRRSLSLSLSLSRSRVSRALSLCPSRTSRMHSPTRACDTMAMQLFGGMQMKEADPVEDDDGASLNFFFFFRSSPPTASHNRSADACVIVCVCVCVRVRRGGDCPCGQRCHGACVRASSRPSPGSTVCQKKKVATVDERETE
jgi:hypothetical protein